MNPVINLRAERLNRGLSSERAAEQIGIGKQVLLNAETGSVPRPEAAFKIATFYGYKVTDIWPVGDEEPAAA